LQSHLEQSYNQDITTKIQLILELLDQLQVSNQHYADSLREGAKPAKIESSVL